MGMLGSWHMCKDGRGLGFRVTPIGVLIINGGLPEHLDKTEILYFMKARTLREQATKGL